jgi:hypothetical protein
VTTIFETNAFKKRSRCSLRKRMTVGLHLSTGKRVKSFTRPTCANRFSKCVVERRFEPRGVPSCEWPYKIFDDRPTDFSQCLRARVRMVMAKKWLDSSRTTFNLLRVTLPKQHQSDALDPNSVDFSSSSFSCSSSLFYFLFFVFI